VGDRTVTVGRFWSTLSLSTRLTMTLPPESRVPGIATALYNPDWGCHLAPLASLSFRGKEQNPDGA